MPKIALLLGVAVAALSTAALAADTGKPEIGTYGFDPSGEDKAVAPGDNFFEFADGTYVKNLEIPPDQTQYGWFNKLRDLSEARTRTILEEQAGKASAAPSDSLEKAGAFYKSFMDEAAIEKLGTTPLKEDLAAIEAVKTPADFARLNGLATKRFLGQMFGLDIDPDPKDTTRYAIMVSQGGLGMPDRDYYLTEAYAQKKQQYEAYAAKMLGLVAWPNAVTAAKDVVAFETKIAEASWPKAESRDPLKVYNPMSLPELAKAAPGFDWAAFCAAADLGSPAQLIVRQNTAIVKIAAILGATPLETLQAWAALQLASNAAELLSKDFVDAHYDFFNKTLQGQPQPKPRWKRAVTAVNTAMGEAIGEEYVKRFYPPVAEAQMQVLTQGLPDAFKNRLEHNAWMSDATKKEALDKLAGFYFQIGHPKKWRDYSGLAIKADDAYGDAERAGAFDWAFHVGHLGKPVDRDLWEMFPQTVNAYNHPLLNEVVFPAAILQPPFFDPNADTAINYGGIGGVIGHEMTHSFDDQGRKYDSHGRLRDWWTPDDAKHFEALADKFGSHYAAMEILPGAHINPKLTMGENIADLGGLTLALDAYHASLKGQPAPVIDGLTGDQRVFLGWAQVWRAKNRDDRARQLLTIDPHSPPVARVNGPMQEIDAWYAAFGAKPGQTLYIAPDDRTRIW